MIVGQADIRDLPYEPGAFDAVCCLGGPLSHVLDRTERARAAGELGRVARDGAPIFVSVMGRLACLCDVVKRALSTEHGLLEPIAETGDYTREIVTERGNGEGWAECHFFRAAEFERELEEGGLAVEGLVGLESVASVAQEQLAEASDEAVESVRAVAEALGKTARLSTPPNTFWECVAPDTTRRRPRSHRKRPNGYIDSNARPTMPDADGSSDPYGRYRQMEIYTAGMLADQAPEYPISSEELEARAREELAPEAFGYVAGGAGAERTIASNDRAFDRWRLVPRVLRDVETRDLSTTLFGQQFSVPFLLAPIGAQEIIHPEGDMASARAAASLCVPFVHSTQGSASIEEVAEAMDGSGGGEGGGTPRWFQLYWSADRDLTANLTERAEKAGYDAIVLTLDTPLLGWRERDLERGYLPFLDGAGLANYFTDPVFRDALDAPPEEDPSAAVSHFTDVFADPSLT